MTPGEAIAIGQSPIEHNLIAHVCNGQNKKGAVIDYHCSNIQVKLFYLTDTL